MPDLRFGFATHFEQPGWSLNLMPLIAATGVGYIRDDLQADHWEPTVGNFVVPTSDKAWIDSAHANGLKVVGIIGKHSAYTTGSPPPSTDPYDPTLISNRAKFIAQSGLIDVIEVTNEPNNDFLAVEGAATWESKLAALTTAVTNAVNSVAPNVTVIGLGAQGNQIISIIPSTTVDGIVYHPYDNDNGTVGTFIPETVYEFQYTNYEGWLGNLFAATSLPVWETEWGAQTVTGFSEDNQACFLVRRMLIAMACAVDHSFIYEFKDNGSTDLFGVYNQAGTTPKASYAVVTRLIADLQGVLGNRSFAVPASSGFVNRTFGVTVNSVANGNTAQAYAARYIGTNKTVVASWFGNTSPTNPPAASTCSLSFPVAHAVGSASVVLNPIAGTSVPLSTYSFSVSAGVLTITNLPITDHPLLISATPVNMGTQWYIRPASGTNGGGGANTGASWTNAWLGFGAINWGSIAPGDTVWISGGTYSQTLNLGKSGTSGSPITIQRATASDGAVVTGSGGWLSGYDSAIIHNAANGTAGIVLNGSFVTIDGRSNPGVGVGTIVGWTINFAVGGVPKNVSGCTGQAGSYSGSGVDLGGNLANIIMRFLKTNGPGNVLQGSDCRGFNLTNVYTKNTITISYCEAGGGGDACIYFTNTTNLIFEHNSFHDAISQDESDGSSCFHPNIVYTGTLINATIRYNRFWNIQVEGWFFGDPNNSQIYFYGNRFEYGNATRSGRAIEYDNASGGNNNIFVYNNTFIDFPNGADRWTGTGFASSASKNNIYYNCSPAYASGVSHDFNLTNGGSLGEANGISSGANPFVSYSAGNVNNNLHIVTTIAANLPRNKGTALTAVGGQTLNTDADGTVRGADGLWDIGAFEFASGVTIKALAGTSQIKAKHTGVLTVTGSVGPKHLAGTLIINTNSTGVLTVPGTSGTPSMVQHLSTGSNNDAPTEGSNYDYSPGTNPGNPFWCTLPNPTLAGNALVLGLTVQNITVGGTATTSTVSDNKGNTWVQRISVNNGGAINQIWTAFNIAAGTQLITVTFNAGDSVWDFQADITEFCNVTGFDVPHSSIATVSPNVNSGAMTQAGSGELIYNYAFDTHGFHTTTQPTLTRVTPAAGFTLLSACNVCGHFSQWAIGSGGSITPGATITTGTDAWNSLSVALTVGPQGSPRPVGIRIAKIYHVFYLATRTVPLMFPAEGNLIFMASAMHAQDLTFQSPTDNKGNTWTETDQTPINDQNGTAEGPPQSYWTQNATTGLDFTVLPHITTTGFPGGNFVFYDVVGAAASAYDSTAGQPGAAHTFTTLGPSGTTSNQPQSNFPTITPSTANGLVICVMTDNFGPTGNTMNVAGQVLDSIVYGGETDQSILENADGYAHFYNPSVAAVNFGWIINTIHVPTTSISRAIAFKAGAVVDGLPPSVPGAPSATAASSTSINLQWTTSNDNITPNASLVYPIEHMGGALASFTQFVIAPGVASGTDAITDTGLTASTLYTYRMRAKDQAGNFSAFTSPNFSATTAVASAAPTFVQSISSDPASTNPVTATFAAIQNAGDCVVVFVGADATNTVTSIVDTKGNVYTLAVARATDGSANSQSVYVAKNIVGAAAGANTITVTFNATPNFPDIRVAEYDGVDLVNPVDASATAQGNGTATSVSVTTTNANDMIVMGGMTAASTSAAGAGYTQRIISAPDSNLLEDRLVSTTGTFAATSTTATGLWIDQVVALRGASVVGPNKPLAGTCSINFNPTGLLTVRKRFAGTCVINTASTGTLHSTRRLNGSCTIDFNPTGTLQSGRKLVGTCTGRFINTGVLKRVSALRGTDTAHAINAGTLDKRIGISGECDVNTNSSGTLKISKRFFGTDLIRTLNTGIISLTQFFAGECDINTANTGALRSTRRLNGTCTIDFNPTGTLRSRRLTAGVCTIDFNPTGTLTREAGLDGACQINTASTGALRSIRRLTGVCTIDFNPTGALTREAGLNGSCQVKAINSGALRSTRRLNGTCTIDFIPTGELTRFAGLNGTCQINTANTGTLRSTRRLNGSCTIDFIPTGTLKVNNILMGTCTVNSASIGVLRSSRRLSGTSTVHANTTADLHSGFSVAFRGTNTIQIVGTGTILVKRLLAGTCTVNFNPAGVIRSFRVLTGTDTISVSAAGLLRATQAIVGTCTVRATDSGALRSFRVLSGTDTVRASSTGLLRATQTMSGTCTVRGTDSGALRSFRILAGTDTVTIAATGALRARQALAATCTVRVTDSGALVTVKLLSGLDTVRLVNSGGLRIGLPLSGSCTVRLINSGAIGSRRLLTGLCTDHASTGTGTLRALSPMSGVCTVRASNTGVLTNRLRGVCSVRAANTGLLSKSNLAGACTATGTNSGALVVTKLLTGTCTERIQNTGSIKATKTVAGTDTIQFSNTGAIRSGIRFVGTDIVHAANTGSLHETNPLTGTCTTRQANTGALHEKNPLAGTCTITGIHFGSLHSSMSGTCAIALVNTGTLASTRKLAGICTGHVNATGVLRSSRLLSATCTVTGINSGVIRVTRRLSGVDTVSMVSTGALKPGKSFVGTCTIRSVSTGRLRQFNRFRGTETTRWVNSGNLFNVRTFGPRDGMKIHTFVEDSKYCKVKVI